MADVPLDTLMDGMEITTAQASLEPESRYPARVVAVSREDVFVELGGREQGILPLRLFPEPPQPGSVLEVVVVRFNPEDGLYEVTLPLAAAEIGDWSQVTEGMLVEARVTGHNAGGLECEVNRLRGFIPVSQISLYRVENLEEFVDQKFTCLVTEANPQRRNLVLSRRAVLEREREEARATILESLAPGQVREGVVRKVLDFGAFVDLGSGVDGLLHVSQLGWGRVKHPSEVVQEGQKISVRVDKVDRESRKISLSYRDLLENPWTGADRKYVVNTVVRSKVVKIMEYGAFVELEPGVEGLVHISELSHKRVPRVSDVVKEGDEIDAVVLSVDPKAQRISLSMKNVNPPPEAEAAAPAPAAEEPPAKPKPPRQPARPLKGGLGRSPRGSKFGLNW
jgi:small subunit ribosomal protein S1